MAGKERQMTDVTALLIIDVVKDNFDQAKHSPITEPALKIIDPINRMIAFFRRHQWPIIYNLSNNKLNGEPKVYLSASEPDPKVF